MATIAYEDDIAKDFLGAHAVTEDDLEQREIERARKQDIIAESLLGSAQAVESFDPQVTREEPQVEPVTKQTARGTRRTEPDRKSVV